MFRKFGVYIKSEYRQGRLLEVRRNWEWQEEIEMVFNLQNISHILPVAIREHPSPGSKERPAFNLAWIVMQNGTSWLSSIEYNFLAEALDGLKL